MKEEWREIKGFEGYYEVSNIGRVRSLTNISEHGYKKVIRPSMNRKENGYKIIHLSKQNKKYTRYVHRVVAEAFVPNPNNYPCVNHKDEVRTNNCFNNLEWCTHKYNNNYGHAIKKRKEKIDYTFKRKGVKQLKNGKVINIFPSIAAAYKYLNKKSGGGISSCCNNKTPFVYGYKWEYVDKAGTGYKP